MQKIFLRVKTTFEKNVITESLQTICSLCVKKDGAGHYSGTIWHWNLIEIMYLNGMSERLAFIPDSRRERERKKTCILTFFAVASYFPRYMMLIRFSPFWRFVFSLPSSTKMYTSILLRSGYTADDFKCDDGGAGMQLSCSHSLSLLTVSDWIWGTPFFVPVRKIPQKP